MAAAESAGSLRPDYDVDPDRFAANQETARRFSTAGDVHTPVADRLTARVSGPVLDLGGGNGILAGLLAERGVAAVVADPARYVDQAPGPKVRAEAEHLPFADESFEAVAALWMLYHLPDLNTGLAEIRRVLRPGGVFVSCTSSRFNDPEVAELLPDFGHPFSFDAETAPQAVATVFDIDDTEDWDEPMTALPDRAAAETYLRGRGLSASESHTRAAMIATPLKITKRGVLVWAHRPRTTQRS